MTSTSPRQWPIRVGVVGLSASGGWAAIAHVPALAGLDGYELRALSASSDESARAAGEKYAVPLTSSGSRPLRAVADAVDRAIRRARLQRRPPVRPSARADHRAPRAGHGRRSRLPARRPAAPHAGAGPGCCTDRPKGHALTAGLDGSRPTLAHVTRSAEQASCAAARHTGINTASGSP